MHNQQVCAWIVCMLRVIPTMLFMFIMMFVCMNTVCIHCHSDDAMHVCANVWSWMRHMLRGIPVMQGICVLTCMHGKAYAHSHAGKFTYMHACMHWMYYHSCSGTATHVYADMISWIQNMLRVILRVLLVCANMCWCETRKQIFCIYCSQ
jgi:hypothetical protein